MKRFLKIIITLLFIWVFFYFFVGFLGGAQRVMIRGVKRIVQGETTKKALTPPEKIRI